MRTPLTDELNKLLNFNERKHKLINKKLTKYSSSKRGGYTKRKYRKNKTKKHNRHRYY
jgi:hypothetical protein